MSNTDKKGFFHDPNPWVLTIGGIVLAPIITAIITGVVDFFQDRDVFHTFLSIVTWIWVKIVWFMLIDVKVIHVVGIVVLVGIVKIIQNGFLCKQQTPEIKLVSDEEPTFLSYTEDYFNGRLKWSWEYKLLKSSHQYAIINLLPHCPKAECDIPLMMSRSNGICPKCHSSQRILYSPDQYSRAHTYIEDPAKVEAVITDNLKKGKFPGFNPEK